MVEEKREQYFGKVLVWHLIEKSVTDNELILYHPIIDD